MGRKSKFRNAADKPLEKMAEADTSKTISEAIATRQNSFEFFNSIMDALPNPDPVLQKMHKSIEVYEDLMFDSRVSACVGSRKSKIISMEWQVVGDKTPEAEIEFYNEIFENLNLEDTITEMLDAAFFGYKPFEIIWGESNGKIIPVEFVGKPPRWFVYDENNQFRFLTKTNMIEGVLVPENRFIVCRKNPTYDNPYGKPALSACFWPVSFRKSGLKFWTIFLEKYGMPFLKATAEAGASAARMAEVADMLNDMVTDAIAVVPDGYNLEIVESVQGKSGDGMHKVYIDMMNLEIAMAILGTNLTTEVQGGSFAASQSHMDVRDDIIGSDKKMVESSFNELIKIIHGFNFTTEAPEFKLFSEEKANLEQAELDVKLYQTGVRFTREHYIKKYNLNETDFEITEEQEKEPEPIGVKKKDGE